MLTGEIGRWSPQLWLCLSLVEDRVPYRPRISPWWPPFSCAFINPIHFIALSRAFSGTSVFYKWTVSSNSVTLWCPVASVAVILAKLNNELSGWLFLFKLPFLVLDHTQVDCSLPWPLLHELTTKGHRIGKGELYSKTRCFHQLRVLWSNRGHTQPNVKVGGVRFGHLVVPLSLYLWPLIFLLASSSFLWHLITTAKMMIILKNTHCLLNIY
jgi:hypothetical protein